MFAVEILALLALIVLNGLLAMSELAIVSARPGRLKMLADRDVRGSRRALALASDPGKFLSTVQIGITLVGVLSGALSGATLGLRLSQWLAGLGVPLDAAEFLGVAVVVAAITYLSLIVGELVPKQIALRDPEAVAVRVAPAMTVLSQVSSPLVWVLDASGKALLRVLGQRAVAEDKISQEEIRTLVAEAETAGVIDPEEKEMITRVMRLGDRRVAAVMTPRTDVEMVDLSEDSDTIRKTILESRHSRLPAYSGTPDEVAGIVVAKDVLDVYLRGEQPDWRTLVRDAPVIPDSLDVGESLDRLKQSPVHLGLIHDEYGHFLGIVTTADILESIVGEFRTEEGPAEPAYVRRADGSLVISGWMPVDEFADLLAITLPDDRAYHTAAGFVLEAFGALPQVGTMADSHGWRFEILDLDGRRIDKVLASRLASTRRAAVAGRK